MADNFTELSQPDRALTAKKLFINSIENFSSGNIARYLSKCFFKGTLIEEQEEEEEEEDELRDESSIDTSRAANPGMPNRQLFEITGTISHNDSFKPDFDCKIVERKDRLALFEILLQSDVIIYNISEDAGAIDEAVWAITELHAAIDDLQSKKTFILISTVMTWAKSALPDPEDPEVPFTQDDFRKRKAHANFKDHVTAEKTVVKLGKTKKSRLSTFVIASGLTYGREESLFHDFFRRAWMNDEELIVFGSGRNILPTIHVLDLASVVHNVIDRSPKSKYLLAIDDSKVTLKQIVRAIGRNLATGKIKKVGKAEAFLSRNLQQETFDLLTLDLRMDATTIREEFNIKWLCEGGPVERMPQIVQEFRKTRNLLPIRIFIHGPPGVGKSSIAGQICKIYKIHHVNVKDVISETLQRLAEVSARERDDVNAVRNSAREELEEEEEEEEEDEEEEGPGTLSAEEAGEYLEELRECQEKNGGRFDDALLVRMVREKLKSSPARNQGFILDGFPKTIQQAAQLFAADEGGDDETDEFDRNLIPEVVISLEAEDGFLRRRIMNLPESQVSNTHNTETGLTRRLQLFRRLNTEENSVLNYFDELEIHPDVIDVSTDESEAMDETVEKIEKIIGKPRNYGPTREEREERMRREEEEKMAEERRRREESECEEREEAARRAERRRRWDECIDDVRREEHEALKLRALPMRHYLMEHVTPTLADALLECCQLRPDDAVDYLAEYLLKNSPAIE